MEPLVAAPVILMVDPLQTGLGEALIDTAVGAEHVVIVNTGTGVVVPLIL